MDKRAFPVCLFLLASLPIQSWASPTPPASSEWISKKIKADLNHRTKSDFDPLLKTWETLYGSAAVQSLVNIAGNPKESDSSRYVSIMGIAKLGGPKTASLVLPVLLQTLKDKSWMIRNAGLRALSILKDPSAKHAVVSLLKDPALVVRLEAVSTLTHLDPKGAPSDFVRVIEDPLNYHHGKAMWVPARALRAIEALTTGEQDRKLTVKLSERLAEALAKVPDAEFRAEIQKSLTLMKRARL